MAQPSWPQERVERLKELAAQKLSAGQIGAELGVSRNAVIGRLRRMGIPLLGAIMVKRLDTPKKTKRVNGLQIRHRMTIPDVPLPPRSREVVAPLKLDILQLTNDSCRWVLDERDKHGRALFCGHPQIPGRSYCFQHCCICHLDMKREFVASEETVA